MTRPRPADAALAGALPRARAFAWVAVAASMACACNSPSPRISQDGSSAAPVSSPHDVASTTTTSMSASAASGAPIGEARDANARVRVVRAGDEGDALSLVRTERLKAKAEGRVLVVYAGAAWCEPCKRFKAAVHDGSLDAKLAKVTLLVFDADRDTERLASAGYTFQFIPYAALPGADGRPADTAEARAKGSEAWRELLDKLEAWQKGA